jgi:Alternative complex III, ActD subunit
MVGRRGLYGVMGEFLHPHDLLHAIEAVRAEGYTKIDAYSPHPIEEVWEAIGHRKSPVPLIVLIGGLVGGLGGFFLQYWVSAIEHPLNVGGRPYNSWPAFIPVTFECTILGAVLAAVAGVFILNGLPEPYHPVFNVKNFAYASRDRYFLCIEASDPKFDRERAHLLLLSVKATEVTDVSP